VNPPPLCRASKIVCNATLTQQVEDLLVGDTVDGISKRPRNGFELTHCKQVIQF
jgi:hypothetical protein